MTSRDRNLIVANIFAAATLVASGAIAVLICLSLVWLVLLIAAEFGDR